MKNNERYQETIPLFHVSRKVFIVELHYLTLCLQTIDPEQSKYNALTTKVEISMKKTSGVSWATLEPSDAKSWTTFGVTGGGGSVGAKEMMYTSDSPLHLKQQIHRE